MPTFRTTNQIFNGEGEYWDENWMDSNKLVLPSTSDWDYQREMQIEDVNIWEVIAEPWDKGVYASWDPYAEFYLVRLEKQYGQKNINEKRTFQFETYYGPGANIAIQKRMSELNIPYKIKNKWVENEDMWLYSEE
jgi:hypothetical protein